MSEKIYWTVTEVKIRIFAEEEFLQGLYEITDKEQAQKAVADEQKEKGAELNTYEKITAILEGVYDAQGISKDADGRLSFRIGNPYDTEIAFEDLAGTFYGYVEYKDQYGRYVRDMYEKSGQVTEITPRYEWPDIFGILEHEYAAKGVMFSLENGNEVFAEAYKSANDAYSALIAQGALAQRFDVDTSQKSIIKAYCEYRNTEGWENKPSLYLAADRDVLMDMEHDYVLVYADTAAQSITATPYKYLAKAEEVLKESWLESIGCGGMTAHTGFENRSAYACSENGSRRAWRIFTYEELFEG